MNFRLNKNQLLKRKLIRFCSKMTSFVKNELFFCQINKKEENIYILKLFRPPSEAPLFAKLA